MNRKTHILLYAFTAVALILTVPGAADADYGEAPMLGDLVDQGELPPVAERLPEEPLVVEPVHEVGEYGGTWYRFTLDDTFDWTIMKMYGHSPVRWVDDGLGIEPNWVADWESNEEATVWTLHLREGVRWSDGEPLTTADFMFWWEEMVLHEEHEDPVPDIFAVEGEPAEVTAVDDYTIEIEYAAPAPLLPERLAMWPNAGHGERMIAPKHYLTQYHPDFTDEYDDMEELHERQEWHINPGMPVLSEWMPVDHAPGERLELQRNPYFYAVDTEGNQLPYIDSMVVEYLEDREVVLLRWMEGDAHMNLRPYAEMTDFSMLIDAQERGGYTMKEWDSGSGTGVNLYPNWNHPDEDKRELYRTPEFRRAMSHAMDRERIQDMLFFGMGTPTTGTLSPNTIEFHRTDTGQELYEQWRDAYVEHDPEKAQALLDEIGVVDQNEDGWRQMPDGEELQIRIDYDAEETDRIIRTIEMVASDWEEIGIDVVLNPTDGAALEVMVSTAEFDWYQFGISDGPNFWVFPQWVVPVDLSRWAPLYGAWYMEEQASTAHDEDDLDPRDRSPARKQPDDDDPVRRLQRIYDQARVEPDEEKRDEHAFDIMRIHIEEGPFFIGTIKDFPVPVIVSDDMHNVPDGDDLELGGFVHPWIMAYPAITMPAQYYMTE